MPRVTYRNIFEDNSDFVEIQEGHLLEVVYQYAKQVGDEIYDLVIKEKIAIFLNGEPLEVNKWHSTFVEKDDEIVVVSRLEGGNKFFGFLFIAVGIAAIAFAPALGGALAGTLGASAATWATRIIFTGISMIFSGISRVLFTPDLPALPEVEGSSKSTPTYNWSGIRTLAKSDASVPIVYGTTMVGGNIISAYTENEGNDNYLNLLLVLCEGEIDGICQETDHTKVCTTSNPSDSSYKNPAIYINDQPFRNYDNVTWWYRTGTNKHDPIYDAYYPFVQNPIPHLNQARVQVDDGREISTDWLEYTTQKEVDAVTLTIKANALYDATGNDLKETSVEYEIQFKEENEGVWHTFYPKQRWYPTSDNPVYIRCNSYSDGEYRTYKTEGIRIKVVSTSVKTIISDWPYPQYYSWVKRVKFNVYDLAGNKIHTGTVYEDHDYPVRGYRINFSGSVTAGMEANITSQLQDLPTGVISGQSNTPILQSHTIDFTSVSGGSGNGIYNIRIRRTTAASSDMKKADMIILDSVVESVYGNFIYPNTALLGLRIKATGQLSGGLPSIKTLIRGLKVDVPDHSGTESFDELFYNETLDQFETAGGSARTWDESTYIKEYSENAMLCVRDLILNDRYGMGKYLSESDLYKNGVIDAIKLCHKKWAADQIDYFSWYSGGNNSEWANYWSFTVGNGSGDSSARTISSDGQSREYTINFRFNASLSTNIEHTFSITFDSLSEVSNIYIYGETFDGSQILLGSKASISAGTHQIIFTPTVGGIRALSLDVSNSDSEGNNVTFTISNVELKNSTSSYEHLHTMNGVIDSKQSAVTALFEMCDSFRCWPVWLNGKYSFVIDKDDTPVHLISAGNVKEFSQTFTPLSEIPYKIYGQFLDKDLNYQMRSLVARTTDPTIPKAVERTLGFKWLTDRRRVERELKFKLNKATNVSHMVNFKCGLDKLHATAGDIVYLQHPLPSWGEGGRILSYSGNNIILDKAYTFNDVSTTYLIRYSTGDNSFVTATVNLSGVSNGDSLQEIAVLSATASPVSDSVYAIGKQGTIKPFRLLTVNRDNNNEISVSAIEHLSQTYDEDSIVVVRDNYSELGEHNIYRKPNPPLEFSVQQVSIKEGIGFEFYVKPDTDSNIKYTTIEWSTNLTDGYSTLLTISPDNNKAKYINNLLQVDTTYYFKAYTNTEYKSSDPTFTSVKLEAINYKPDPPSGIYIKGQNPNSTTFSDKDITIEWNPVRTAPFTSGPLSGYVVEVYHDSPISTNLLRTSFVKDEKYTYTFDNNYSDSNGNPYSTLVFVVYSRTDQGILSDGSRPFRVENVAPPIPTNVSAAPIVGGVQFGWDASQENDHKHYTYRIKVGTGSYYGWFNNAENNVVYTLTATDIDLYSNTANVKIFVKDVDYFGNESNTASAEASANIISGNVFRLIPSSSVTGSIDQLYDGDFSSGGITI